MCPFYFQERGRMTGFSLLMISAPVLMAAKLYCKTSKFLRGRMKRVSGEVGCVRGSWEDWGEFIQVMALWGLIPVPALPCLVLRISLEHAWEILVSSINEAGPSPGLPTTELSHWALLYSHPQACRWMTVDSAPAHLHQYISSLHLEAAMSHLLTSPGLSWPY